MKRHELLFSYPDELIGIAPQYPPRVLFSDSESSKEVPWAELLGKFKGGDVLVLNDTKVLKRRVFTEDGLEILFLNRLLGANSNDFSQWEVLFPSKKYQVNQVITLPLGVQAKLLQKGRPQILELSPAVDESYFEKIGELPLPPYIQRARAERHNLDNDKTNYQTAWAEKPGSLAAPTASLHFKTQDLEFLKNQGVEILKITLHVGLGTFLPITVEDLKDHVMHSEMVEIENSVWEKILFAKAQNARVWSLGTTVTRSLESQALGYFQRQGEVWRGATDLLIQPGFEFKVIDNLLTNFHQPESTLLALVAAFSDLEKVKKAYALAIEKRMRLFSYGDLSVWTRN